jgi:hypothetical protein
VTNLHWTGRRENHQNYCVPWNEEFAVIGDEEIRID